MSFVSISGQGPLLPRTNLVSPASGFASTGLIDATGEKFAMMGRVWFNERSGSKNVRRVGFRFGAVTKAGGSALTVSLQDVSTATAPAQPDGVQDQTVAIANADAGFASNTWYRTGAFSADRPVAYGEQLAVVIEYDGAGRLGADSVVISQALAATSTVNPLEGCCSLFTASWATLTGLIVMVLEFDDGTFGILEGALPLSAITAATVNSGSATQDEYAATIQLPYPVKVDGLWAFMGTSAASADFEVILYSGTTPLQTVVVDATQLSASAARYTIFPIPETTLSANTLYRVGIRPTTVNNVSIHHADVNDANIWKAMDGGAEISYDTRLNQGAWIGQVATRRLWAGIRISAFDDGAGSGGGAILSRVRSGY